MRFLLFGVLSTLVFTGFTLHSFYVGQFHFFVSLVALVRNPIAILSLFGSSGSIGFYAGNGLLKLLFGELRVIEVEHIYEKLWFAAMDTCLALTVFRNELDFMIVFFISFYLFIKILHWVVSDRIDFMDQMPEITFSFHARTLGVLAVLGLIDGLMLGLGIRSLMKRGPDVFLIFSYEFTILFILALFCFGKYSLHTIDRQFENPWEEKGRYILYLEIGTVALAGLFAYILSHIGLPIHMLRDLYLTAYSLFTKIYELYRYRQATLNMMAKYPNATRDELNTTDGICIICREEMVIQDLANNPGNASKTPKKLPCGHIFHLQCLKSWLERQLSCPTCRTSVFADPVPNNAPIVENEAQPVVEPPNQPDPVFSRQQSFETLEEFMNYANKHLGKVQLEPVTASAAVPESILTPERIDEILKSPQSELRSRLQIMNRLMREMQSNMDQMEMIVNAMPTTKDEVVGETTATDSKGKNKII